MAGYRIEGVLGRGGMGRVYEATQMALERTVALKILGEDLSSDEAFRARFRREGRIQGGIAHPHIVGVHEAGEVDGHLFIAMQLVRGPTLKRLVTSGDLEPARAVRLLRQVADALDAAHAAGLTHRDVKPQNILVGDGDHAYLADFGLTKTLSDSAGYTRTGQFVGTIDYISPEQISGEPATPASDIYALGAILYESLTGLVPFPRDSEAAVLFAHISGEPPKVSTARADLPGELDDLIARVMAKDPLERPATAGVLMAEAEEVVTGRRGTSSRFRQLSADVAGAGGMPTLPLTDADFPPTMEPGSRLIPPESDPGFTIPDHPPLVAAYEPAPAPADARPARRGRMAVALGAVVAVAAAGTVLGRAGSQDGVATPQLTGSAANTALVTRFPASWSPRSEGPEGRALHLADPVSLATQEGGGATFDAGVTSASTTRLLPDATVGAVVGRLPEAERVRVGALTAYRYRNLRLRGVAGTLTVLAAPTSVGVVTMVCAGSTTAITGPGGCERIAASVRLRRGRSLVLGPDAAYARTLGQTLVQLNEDRAAARRQMRDAGGPTRQARAASTASRAYARAAKALDAVAPGPADRALHLALRADVLRVERAYRALATASRGGDRPGFATAAAAIRDRERALDQAVARLRSAGYRVG